MESRLRRHWRTRPRRETHEVLLVDEFVTNLDTSSGHGGHRSLYSISGPAGTGKSHLLKLFLAGALRVGAATAWVDQAEMDVLSTLRTFVDQLGSPGSFKEFSETDRRHSQLVRKLVVDESAPDDLALTLSRGISQGVLAAGRQVPGLALPLAFVDDEALAPGAQKLITFIQSAVDRDEDYALLLDPIGHFSRAFVDGLSEVTEPEHPVALFFDAFERTSPVLETWLQHLIDKTYGRLPASAVIAIADQKPLSRISWGRFEGLMRRLELDAFTDAEARLVLEEFGITSQDLVEHLLTLSGRLPVLLTMLAAQKPQSVSEIANLPSDAIEVFLKWITEPELRELAIDAALPRLLNEDVMSIVGSELSADTQWGWLRKQAFVEEQRTGWRYTRLHAGCCRITSSKIPRPNGEPSNLHSWSTSRPERRPSIRPMPKSWRTSAGALRTRSTFTTGFAPIQQTLLGG